MNNITEDINKNQFTNHSINDSLQNNESEEEDVTFLISGGNEEYNLKDFSNINNKDNSSISVSELLINNNKEKDNQDDQIEQSQQYNQNNNPNNNMIYIENEDTAFEENPCKNMLMVWDVNPESRPWSRLLDVSPWFNYGFTEKTFKEYIIRQLGIRWERIKKQNIETSDDLLNNNVNNFVHNNNEFINSNIINNNNIGLNSNNSNIDINNTNANLNSNVMIMGANHSMLNNSLPNYNSNMIYYPPHITPSHVGHPPNIYHQQHIYGNYPPPPIMHHTVLPPNTLNTNNINYSMLRGKKRSQE